METKSGIRTTEFWLTVITAAGALIAALASELPPRYAAIASAISVGLYAIGRGQAKSGVKPDNT